MDKNFFTFDHEIIYEMKLVNGRTKRLEMDELLRVNKNPPNPIPEMHGNVTIIPNYVLTFWMPIMKPGPFAVYVQLIKMAYGDKDFAFPSLSYLSQLTGKSVKTVMSYLEHLNELGLVIIIHRKKVSNFETLSNLYLMSSVTSFLPQEHYNKLPERLRAEHDQFIERLEYRKVLEADQLPTYHSKKKRP